MKTSISNYIKYENILKNSFIKDVFDDLVKNFPQYKFLTIYHRDYEEIGLKSYSNYILLGSKNDKLVFLENKNNIIDIVYIEEKTFNKKLLANNNLNNYEFYEENSIIVNNMLIKELTKYINSGLI